MNKKLIISAIGALLLVTGCSKQPTLENAVETNTTQSTKAVQKSNENAPIEQNATVNTANAEIQTENIEPQAALENINNKSINSQQFAKDISKVVVYFDFDKYNIKPSEWPKVEKLAKMIKENNKNYTIRIEGNCDEWGTEEYNYALGLRRANTVKNALIKLGVDPKKLTVISYGKLNPVCTAHAKWCWRKNRRDNFTYLP